MEKSVLVTGEYFSELTSSEKMNRNSRIVNIYDRHIETVYRVCYSMIGNRQDTEDIVQSVFLKLLECGKTFNDSEHEKAWLIRTAQNQCRDFHRKWWKRKVVHLHSQMILGESKDTPSDERITDTEEALQRLNPSHRLLLYLYYYEGYKLTEIADLLKLNPNTVKTRMRSARKQLKIRVGDGERNGS